MKKKLRFSGKKPHLKFLFYSRDFIFRLHPNDFRQFSISDLSESEARAIYYHVPNFRPDQEFQFEWKEKIAEHINSKQAIVTKPIQPSKKVVIHHVDPSRDNDVQKNIFTELLQKRKRKGSDVSRTSTMITNTTTATITTTATTTTTTATISTPITTMTTPITTITTCSATMPTRLPVKQTNSQVRPLDQFILFQHADGSFEISEEILQFIGKTRENLFKGVPAVLKESSRLLSLQETLWMTAIALVYFEMKFPELEDEWSLIAEKSKRFLKQSLNNASVSYVLDAARKVLSN